MPNIVRPWSTPFPLGYQRFSGQKPPATHIPKKLFKNSLKPKLTNSRHKEHLQICGDQDSNLKSLSNGKSLNFSNFQSAVGSDIAQRLQRIPGSSFVVQNIITKHPKTHQKRRVPSNKQKTSKNSVVLGEMEPGWNFEIRKARLLDLICQAGVVWLDMCHQSYRTQGHLSQSSTAQAEVASCQWGLVHHHGHDVAHTPPPSPDWQEGQAQEAAWRAKSLHCETEGSPNKSTKISKVRTKTWAMKTAFACLRWFLDVF